ncbi:unnamed protein product, partial [Sphenostylis stenocarpa]
SSNREIDRISYRGFTMFRMNTTTLINTLRAPLSKVRNKRKSIKHEARWNSIPNHVISAGSSNREIDRISYRGFTMFQMNTTTLINTLRAPLSNWDSNPDRLVSTSGQRNVPDELLRIYNNMNA